MTSIYMLLKAKKKYIYCWYNFELGLKDKSEVQKIEMPPQRLLLAAAVSLARRKKCAKL